MEAQVAATGALIDLQRGKVSIDKIELAGLIEPSTADALRKFAHGHQECFIDITAFFNSWIEGHMKLTRNFSSFTSFFTVSNVKLSTATRRVWVLQWSPPHEPGVIDPFIF